MILEVLGTITLIFIPFVLVGATMVAIEWSRKFPIW